MFKLSIPSKPAELKWPGHRTRGQATLLHSSQEGENTDFLLSLILEKGIVQQVKAAGLNTYSPGDYGSALGFLYFKVVADSYKFSRAGRKRSLDMPQ